MDNAYSLDNKWTLICTECGKWYVTHAQASRTHDTQLITPGPLTKQGKLVHYDNPVQRQFPRIVIRPDSTKCPDCIKGKKKARGPSM